jgi:hypothetical protein
MSIWLLDVQHCSILKEAKKGRFVGETEGFSCLFSVQGLKDPAA